MKERKTVKVYISDVNEPYNYESVKNIIDECLDENFSGKEILMLCLEKKDSLSLGEKYAVDKGMEIECFRKSKFLKERRIVKHSDFMILFRGEDISDIATLFECAVKCGTPLQMLDIA